MQFLWFDFLQFLWFGNNNFGGHIVHWKMTRLSYGLLRAQSGSLFCLEKMLDDNETGASDMTVKTAKSGFYVNNSSYSFPLSKK